MNIRHVRSPIKTHILKNYYLFNFRM
jgi:hypothetical protein